MSVVSMTASETGRTVRSRTEMLAQYVIGDHETASIENDVSQELIECRSHEIVRGWTRQQRAERRRVGTARRAWFISLVDHFQAA